MLAIEMHVPSPLLTAGLLSVLRLTGSGAPFKELRPDISYCQVSLVNNAMVTAFIMLALCTY
jgi:hypothetical protein